MNDEFSASFSILFSIQHSAFRIIVIDLTPRTPYRQRTGVLFGAVMIGHLILISAQVQSKAGVPVLEGITFGVFSRLQGGAAGFFRGIGGVWGNYVGLRGAKAENEMLKQEVAALEVRLQEQRALMERQLAQCRAAVAAAVIQHRAKVEPFARYFGHRGERGGRRA